jgi:RHS repeat-associated protein
LFPDRLLELAAITDTSAGLAVIDHRRSFYDGPAFVGLPLGQVDKHGAVTRSEVLALTDDVLQQAYGTDVPPYLEPTGTPAWTADYPVEFRSLLARRAGYTFHTGSASPTDLEGYFITTERRRYDVHTNPNGRGLVLETLDPLHEAASAPSAHRVMIDYDEFQLLSTTVTNAAALTTTAVHDYRVLRPAEVTDANGNVTRFTYSPVGLLSTSWVRGKSAAEGDRVRPSVRLDYDFLTFEHSPPEQRQPISVRTTRHVYHDTASGVALRDPDETITTIEYSDGFGRLLQTRTQDDEVRFGDLSFGGGIVVLPDTQGAGAGGDVVGRLNANAAQPNVVVSGWRIYDKKGRVVQQYEPFFSEGWSYGQPTDEQRGHTLTMFYDPRGHAIRTLMPDASEQLVVLGVPGTIAALDLERPDVFEPTPWEVYSYDANDNAGRTHPAVSAGYRHHWNTPSSIRLDALGRTIEAVERNRDVPAVLGGALPPIEELRTRTTYDIRGNALTVTDARGRTAIQNVFDLTNRTLRVNSIDAGERRSVPNASGIIIETRASNGALVLSASDGLNRPIRLWARDGAGQALTLRERREYGDAGTASQPPADRAAARAANQLGRLSRVFDEAGQLSYNTYDFKGNLLEKTRRVISHAEVLGVFAGPPAGWDVRAYRVDWTNPAGTPLETAAYTSTLAYDALNRATRITYPEDAEHARRVSVPIYNRSGALRSVELDGDVFVERIACNAKRQRVLIAYGNGVMTRSTYDPRTFHLLRMRTERFSSPASLTYRHTGEVLQDLVYEYDLVGNVIAIHDRTPNSGINGTPLGPDALNRTFTYDAIYRLRSATGRECDHPPDVPWDSTLRCTDLTKVRPWTEEYTFDSTGNLTKLRHQSGATAAIGDFTVPAAANRVSTLTQGLNVFTYEHDANGNLTRETTSRHLEWDHRDRLRVYRTQTAGSEPTVHTHYLYDSTGQRVEKIVRKPGARVEITVYIAGMFEHERIITGGSTQENSTLHLMDDRARIATVRVGSPFTGDTTPGVKFHLADHLGNIAVIVDATGSLVSREEYLPYGSTSFGSFARKRYRFGGYERDAESGLYYAGARYYIPWLGRWASCEPAGAVDGLNLYAYVRGRPLARVDRVGLAGGDPFPPDPSREAAKEMRVMASGPSQLAKKLADAAVSGWNAFRTKVTQAVFDRQEYDKAKAADLPTVKPNAGLMMTDKIVKETPEASGNAFLVMAGAVRTKAPAGAHTPVESPAGEAKVGQQPKAAQPEAQPAPPVAESKPGESTAPKPKVEGTVETVAAELFRLRDQAWDEAMQRVQSNPQLAETMTPARFGNLVDEIFKNKVMDSISAKRLPDTFRVTATSNKGVAYGIDVYDTATGEGYDVHPANERQVLKHMDKYEGETMPDGTVINNVNPLVYQSPWK